MLKKVTVSVFYKNSLSQPVTLVPHWPAWHDSTTRIQVLEGAQDPAHLLCTTGPWTPQGDWPEMRWRRKGTPTRSCLLSSRKSLNMYQEYNVLSLKKKWSSKRFKSTKIFKVFQSLEIQVIQRSSIQQRYKCFFFITKQFQSAKMCKVFFKECQRGTRHPKESSQPRISLYWENVLKPLAAQLEYVVCCFI